MFSRKETNALRHVSWRAFFSPVASAILKDSSMSRKSASKFNFQNTKSNAKLSKCCFNSFPSGWVTSGLVSNYQLFEQEKSSDFRHWKLVYVMLPFFLSIQSCVWTNACESLLVSNYLLFCSYQYMSKDRLDNMLNWDIVVSELELQSCYRIHFGIIFEKAWTF